MVRWWQTDNKDSTFNEAAADPATSRHTARGLAPGTRYTVVVLYQNPDGSPPGKAASLTVATPTNDDPETETQPDPETQPEPETQPDPEPDAEIFVDPGWDPDCGDATRAIGILSLDAVTHDSISFSWSALNCPGGYAVRWWQTGDKAGTFTEAAVDRSTSRHTAGGLAPGTGYTIRVLYQDPDGKRPRKATPPLTATTNPQ